MATDSLHSLIHILSIEEKKKIKKLLKTDTKTEELGHNLNFFLAFEECLEFNKEDIQKRLKLTNNDNLFSVVKYNLYQKILDILWETSTKNEIKDQVNQLIEKSEILFNKCLFNESYKLCLDAKELAKEYELVGALYNIINHELRLLSKLGGQDFYTKVEEVLNEQEREIEKSRNIVQYNKLYYKLVYAISGNKCSKQESTEIINKLVQEPLLNDYDKALYFNSKRLFININVLLTDISGNNKNRIELLKKEIELWESHPKFKELHQFIFYLQLYNLLDLCIDENEFDNFNSLFEKFKIKPTESRYNQDSVLLFSEILKAKIATKEGDTKTGLTICKKLLNMDVINSNSIVHNHFKLILNYYCAYAYFLNNDFKNVNVYINEIINNKWQAGKELINFVRLFSEIVLLESKKQALMLHSLESTKKYFERHNLLNNFERILLKQLKEIINADSLKEIKELFLKFKEQLTGSYTPAQLIKSTNVFDIVAWADSKIEGKPMVEILKDKANNKIIL